MTKIVQFPNKPVDDNERFPNEREQLLDTIMNNFAELREAYATLSLSQLRKLAESTPLNGELPEWARDDSPNEPTSYNLKEAMLQHYGRLDEPTYYYQIDGWINKHGANGDDFIFPNGDRYGMTGGINAELWSDHPMRLSIGQGVSKEDLVALLKNALEWVERDYEQIQNEFANLEDYLPAMFPPDSSIPDWL